MTPASPNEQTPPAADPNQIQAVARAGRTPKCIILFVTTLAFVLASDLLLKAWSFSHVAGEPVVLSPRADDGRYHIPFHEPVTVIPGVLSFRLTTNTGAVFGLGKGAQWFFALVSLIATAIIMRIFWRSSAGAWVFHTALAMILAGALGNLYDRIVFRAVRDMLWLFPGIKLPFGLTWPGGVRDVYPWLFNIADAALVIGVIVVLLLMRREDMQPQNEQSAPH